MFAPKKLNCTQAELLFGVQVSMLVRIVRQLLLEEVQNRIRKYENEYRMTFDKFEELLFENKGDHDFLAAYYEWARLVDAYRGYVESGELDYVVEEVRDLNPKEMALLSPKRLELLYSLGNLRIQSINDLAQKTRRNVKNVHEDLKTLASLDLVMFKKQGKRNMVPETLVEEITFLVR